MKKYVLKDGRKVSVVFYKNTQNVYVQFQNGDIYKTNHSIS